MATDIFPASTPTAAPHTCATCGRHLTGKYYILVGRRERYCPTCIKTRPRCDTCGAPLGAGAVRLHDERLQCALCHKTAVYDPVFAQQLFYETVQHLATHFGLILQVGVEFRLVDMPTLQALYTPRHATPPERVDRTLGLYHRRGHLRAIYMLYGLPRLLFRTTVAHEYAHAWQGEACPLLNNFMLREGFAEWVAYRHLQALGSTKAAARMLNANHPYRPALEHVLRLEEQFGTTGLIDYMRRAE